VKADSERLSRLILAEGGVQLALSFVWAFSDGNVDEVEADDCDEFKEKQCELVKRGLDQRKL
jgi:hypothetical protein